jgi:ElaB/YqjD/DUF883 family membrane-anchored ribosome-binding protein
VRADAAAATIWPLKRLTPDKQLIASYSGVHLMARSSTNGASLNVKSLKKDLQSLRDDMLELSKQVEGLASNAGGEVLDDVKANLARFGETVDDLLANAGTRGREAVDAVGEMGGNVVENVEDAIREHPLSALAIAVGLGFVLSSTMRR